MKGVNIKLNNQQKCLEAFFVKLMVIIYFIVRPYPTIKIQSQNL
jgi:hypothetical protein